MYAREEVTSKTTQMHPRAATCTCVLCPAPCVLTSVFLKGRALSLPDPRLQKSYGPSGRVLRLGACGVHIWAARHPCVLRQRPASYVPALAAKGCSFRSSPTWGGALRPRRCVVHPASSVPHPALAPRVRLRAPDLGGHGRRQGEMQGQYLGAGYGGVGARAGDVHEQKQHRVGAEQEP